MRMILATAQLYQGFFCNIDSKSQIIKMLPHRGTNTCSLYNSLTTFCSGEWMLLNACLLFQQHRGKRDQELTLPVRQTSIKGVPIITQLPE